MFAKAQRVHFIGIGVIGMSGIAEILLTLGYAVSGSDLRRSSITDRLGSLGATVFQGHAAGNVVGSGVVVGFARGGGRAVWGAGGGWCPPLPKRSKPGRWGGPACVRYPSSNEPR